MGETFLDIGIQEGDREFTGQTTEHEQAEQTLSVYEQYRDMFGTMEAQLNALQYADIAERISPPIALDIARRLVKLQMEVITLLHSTNTFNEEEFEALEATGKKLSDQITQMSARQKQ